MIFSTIKTTIFTCVSVTALVFGVIHINTASAKADNVNSVLAYLSGGACDEMLQDTCLLAAFQGVEDVTGKGILEDFVSDVLLHSDPQSFRAVSDLTSTDRDSGSMWRDLYQRSETDMSEAEYILFFVVTMHRIVMAAEEIKLPQTIQQIQDREQDVLQVAQNCKNNLPFQQYTVRTALKVCDRIERIPLQFRGVNVEDLSPEAVAQGGEVFLEKVLEQKAYLQGKIDALLAAANTS